MYARIATLLAGYAILITGNGLLGTLVSLRLTSPAFSSTTVGIVQSAYYLGFMLGALLSGRLIARIGYHRAFAVFAVVVACTSLGYAIGDLPLAWLLLRLVAGFSMAGIFSMLESLLHASADNRVRGRVIAFYMMTTYLGAASGQLLLNLASPSGFELFSLVAVLFSASLLPILVASKPTASAPGKEPSRLDKTGIMRVVFSSPLGVGGCVLAGLLNSVFYTLMPVYLKQAGFSIPALSGVMFSALLTALMFQWPTGFLSDHIDRRKVLAGSCLLIGGLCLILVSGPDGTVLLWLVCFFAATVFTVYPVSVALVNDWVSSDLRLSASAAVLLMFSVGGCAGPIFASIFIGSLGPAGLFWFCITAVSAFLVGCLLSLWNPQSKTRSP